MLKTKPKLLATCQRQPPVLVPKGPPRGTRAEHKVRDNESFATIAQKYGVSVKALLLHNFGTTVPEYINYYLDEYVGCDLATPDHKNWRFSGTAWPGKIYIPGASATPAPPPEQQQQEMATIKSWVKRLLIYDPSDLMIRLGAEAFPKQAPGFNAKEGVDDFATALTAIGKYSHVEFLIFETHGRPGYVYFPKGGIDADNANGFRSVSQALEADARVLFEGCNVGEGEKGRKFMLAVGSSLLFGKGGFVGATNAYNLGSLLELLSIGDHVRLMPWGKLQIMQFDKNGSLIQEQEVSGAVISAP